MMRVHRSRHHPVRGPGRQPSGKAGAAPAETRLAHPGWPVVGAAATGVFFASLVVVTFPVLLKPLAAEFGWTREAVSAAFSLAAIAAAVTAFPLGLLLDRVGARRVALPSLVLLGLLFASLALLQPQRWQLYFLYAALGVVGMGSSPVAYGRAISGWFSARRGLALALVITGGALGGILLPPAAQAITRAFGWRATCFVLGLAALVIGLPMLLRGLRERPAGQAESTRRAGDALRTTLRRPAFWLLVLGLGAGTMLQNSVIVHLAALLTDRGAEPARAALALSAMAGAAVLGRLLTGLVIDRLFAARIACVLMGLAALGAFLLATADSFAAGLLAAVLVGFGTGGEADVVPYLLSRYFGLRGFSTLYGLAWMVGAIGGALGPVAMGRAFDRTGSYAEPLGALAVVGLTAAGLMLALPRYRISDAPR